MSRIAMTIACPDLTGAARMLVAYAGALQDRGHEVLVVHGRIPVDSDGQPATIVEELKSRQIETCEIPLLTRPIPPFVYWQVRAAIGDCAAVIGVNQRDRAVALKVAAILRKPGILSVQNQHSFWGPLFIPALKRHYYAAAVRRADRLICTSQKPMDELVDMGVVPDRCVVLPNAVELAPAELDGQQVFLRRSQLRAEFGVPESARLYCNVGRLDVQKGQDILLEAWSKADRSEDSHLLLVGDASEGAQAERSKAFKSQLQAFVEEKHLEDSVTLVGWRDDIRDILRAADVYVHAARWEGWPLAVMEAMAEAKPIIMTDCSGPPLGFEDGLFGFMVTKDDAYALADAIETIERLQNEKLSVMGAEAAEVCRREYDINVIGGRFADIVEAEINSSEQKREST